MSKQLCTSPPTDSAAVAEGSAIAAAGALDWSYVPLPPPTTFDYFTKRYFHQFSIRDCKKVKGNDCRILQHSNGLCVLCLDPNHELVRRCAAADAGVTVAKVEFFKGRTAIMPESIQVVGKKKKNALVFQNDTKVCSIVLSDMIEYTIPACVNGYVLELNAALLEHPWMVAVAPTAEGYLAVINPTSKADFSSYEKVWTATGGDAAGEDDD
ncbi:conserved hypothetical protein [Leishmania braziliensis MHOM/BR/75/M2904]|uniref:Protein Abitram n=2 Tax=Leishmania braziliensis TaxID=5660 RepID=A4HB40_LEIBR|nr:conserved hypothetical protein [Leishmania braziliensis MHOM/BR/75/M2904]KAI5686550.1 hypothetical protein MNV84_03179 [Leishmania braziliensis]CAJ2471523.1 unnamed protein product [Leishmania braziliensis]CAJ2472172.1 unnamed protein product [Leishmania braziliensis]CAM38625.1 conserved hypothetical protein [Leishmania braziliensis MHOM/BR/75/M2904]SYZ65320.1 hypothetical_protein [Leishmania braziliensis MHOM/BR/75/M2904]